MKRVMRDQRRGEEQPGDQGTQGTGREALPWGNPQLGSQEPTQLLLQRPPTRKFSACREGHCEQSWRLGWGSVNCFSFDDNVKKDRKMEPPQKWDGGQDACILVVPHCSGFPLSDSGSKLSHHPIIKEVDFSISNLAGCLHSVSTNPGCC